MIVQLMTPMTWTAALVPLLDGEDVELIIDAERPKVPAEAAAYVVLVDESNVVDIAAWWARRTAQSRNDSLLVVVGAGSLRYQWQLREIGATAVIGHVWDASAVATIVRRQSNRQPASKGKWPAWVNELTPSSE